MRKGRGEGTAGSSAVVRRAGPFRHCQRCWGRGVPVWHSSHLGSWQTRLSSCRVPSTILGAERTREMAGGFALREPPL